MTYADPDFISVEGQEETPNYPKAFGITFTPRVSGVVLGVLGVLGAAYLLLNVVQPEWQRYQELDADVEGKELQLEKRAQIQQQIKVAQQQLVQARQKNRQVLSLFANERTLDTLLLDLNSFVKARNGRITSFKPDAAQQQANAGANNNPYGPLVSDKLRPKRYQVEIEGSFDQMQSILRSFERLQSLLLFKDFRTELLDNQGVLINPQTGNSVPAVFRNEDQKVVPGGKPDLKTSFTLEAPLPVEQSQQAAPNAANPQQEQPPQQQE